MVKSSISTVNIHQQTYHQRIKSRRQRQPGLAVLDGFLDAAIQFLPSSNRRSRFDVTVIHVLNSGTVYGPTVCSTKADFDQAVGIGAPADRISTVILVEDLSYDVVDHLGITYNMPPEVFAVHLRETEAYRTGVYMSPQSPDIEMLPSYIAKAPFYSLRLRRYYHFPGGLKEAQKLRSEETNSKGLNHPAFKRSCILKLPRKFLGRCGLLKVCQMHLS